MTKAEMRMLEILVEENEIQEDELEEEVKEVTLKRLYDGVSPLLTQDVARNGRSVLWYISTNDSAKSIAIYIDTLEELTEQEIEDQLV